VQLLHTGDVVRARRRTWRVADVRSYDTCQVVALTEAGRSDARRCELVLPYDSFEIVCQPSTTLRRVNTSRWRRAARALVARGGIAGLLQTARAAAIDILPHQLAPAVAVLRGDGCRLLLADDVGLGKTIEACLLIAELRARGVADRVIVLAPPGLRDQWRNELVERFRVQTTIADFRAVRERMATVPPDVNPWTTWPVAIASIDYVKRPEVLRAVLNAAWDVVVVDEAHRVANDGERRQATAALTARAGYVVLLTATPHSGNTAAFESLCSLGSQGDRLLTFRRSRGSLSAAVRRSIHRLRVGSTPAERRMFSRLETFAKAVRAEHGEASRDMWIALALLHKRAYSSPHALHLSVTRRLESLADDSSTGTQMLLPLDDLGEESADEAPDWHAALGLADRDRERGLLTAIAGAAAIAANAESKIHVIRRLLRRIAEPAIVFTEYRDTLAWLARHLREPVLLLHGGLSRGERVAIVNAFTNGDARLLLATDAAGEGLNLHHRCRVVINLELPWNPMRLEQRIGRVDRIGQRRAVHVFHLIGADTGETRLLDELRARIARAQAAVGTPDPLDGALDADDGGAIHSQIVDVSGEVSRLRLARALNAVEVDNGRPLLSKARNSKTRARLAGQTLSMWECVLNDEQARAVSSHLVSVSGQVPVDEVIANAVTPSQIATLAIARSFAETALRRSNAITAAIESDALSSHQPGLFDRRVQFAHAAMKAARDEALAAQRDRAQLLRRSHNVVVAPPRLRLVLVP
jgi:superfamily II DNA or RNA helicase